MSPRFRFTVEPPTSSTQDDVDDVFHWSRSGTTQYFGSNISPSLAEFGPVPSANVDFVRIASAVLAADKSSPRSGRSSRWNQRQILVVVDLIEPGPWEAVRLEFEALLAFLTGDVWSLSFVPGAGVGGQLGGRGLGASRVVLFSGGADSASGALLSAAELAPRKEQHALLSHWAARTLPRVQQELASAIDRHFPEALADHIVVHHARGRTSADGIPYRREDSSRSRSLLFIALGLAAAAPLRVPLWVPENGFASINPPLSPNRRGSLSTKTTHPALFNSLRDILDRVGAHHDVENPFQQSTKGEMFTRVRETIGADAASRLLSATTSCSHTGARTYGISPKVACGVCFGCVLRRSSFLAGGIVDRSDYVDPKGNARLQAWLDSKSVLGPLRDFLDSPFDERTIAPLRIPVETSLASVVDLAARARAELRAYCS